MYIKCVQFDKAGEKLRGYGTLKCGDVPEKFHFLEIQEIRPLRTCQKHLETNYRVFTYMGVKFRENTKWYNFFQGSNAHSNYCFLQERDEKYRLVLTYMNETIYKTTLKISSTRLV